MGSHEYTINDFIGILKENSHEELIDKMYEEEDFLDNLLRYLSVDKNILIDYLNEVKEQDNTLFFKVVQSLISLFPLSTSIIEDLVLNNKDMFTNSSDFLKWYDSSEVMMRCFRKFQQMFIQFDRSKKMTDIEESMNDLKASKDSLECQIDNLKKLESSHEKLHDEVKALQVQLSKLEAEWSEDSLQTRKSKLEKDISRLRETQEKQQKTLDALRVHFESLKNVKNVKFKDALERFGDVLDTLSDDEGDK